jgi:hypothetical protein
MWLKMGVMLELTVVIFARILIRIVLAKPIHMTFQFTIPVWGNGSTAINCPGMNAGQFSMLTGQGAHYQNSSAGFGGGLNAGIVNYPGLVDGGNVQIDDSQSGLSDKQKAKNTKVGIGLRDSQHVMVVIAQNVNMLEFAHVFKSLGASGALNLDTGGSTAAIYNGRYIYGPGRNLPNAIIFANK